MDTVEKMHYIGDQRRKDIPVLILADIKSSDTVSHAFYSKLW